MIVLLCENRVMDWSNLEFFLAVARTGSLSSAAKNLQVNHSTVSRRLDRLESDLNIKLFKKDNKGYQLTEHGLALEQEASKVEVQVNKIHKVFHGQQTSLSGTLTLSKPMNGGINMAPAITSFHKLYPNIDLNLISSTNIDLALHEADIAIQMGARPPEDLIARKLGKLPIFIYGSQLYLSKPEHSDINNLDWIIWKDDTKKINMEEELKKLVKSPNIILRTNAYSEAYDYMTAGIGVSLISPLGIPENHNLQAFKPEEYRADSNVWLLYHPDMRNSAKVQVFKEFFIEMFEKMIKNYEPIS